MKFSKEWRLLVIGMTFLISFSIVSAAIIQEDLHVNIQTTDSSGNVVTGTYDFVFNVSTSSDCNNVVYSDSSSLTTDSRGIISYYLEDVNLDYADQYWLCYYRDGTLQDNSQIARTPYAFRAEYVNLSGVEVDSNFDMSGYNMSADYFFGSGRYLTDLNVSELDMSDYFTSSEILSFGYYNLSSFNIDDYYLKSNPFGFYNSTTIPSYILSSDEGNLNVNSSDYWDGLNSPADILGSQINNDLNWINASTANGSYVPYVGADNNVDLGEENISTTGTGLFGFVGNLTSRVTKLFVEDIDASGSVNVSGDLDVGGDVSISGDVNVDGFVYSDVCPEGMAYIDKLGGYCIDKYEASRPDATGSSMGSDTSMAVSQQGVIPWVSISQINARTACENAGKHLCSDEEWIGAANVQGQVYYLPTNLAVAPYYCVTDSSTYCLDNSYAGGEACETGTYSGGASGCYSEEGVYDMVGNVWEWTDEVVDVTNPDGTAGWKYANQEGEWQSSTSGLWNKYGNDGVYFPTTTTGRAVLRGGNWYRGATAGPFCAALNNAPAHPNYITGFRCCSALA